MESDDKSCKRIDLEESDELDYKPAYKKSPENGPNQAPNYPADLQLIINRWDKLPEHIRQAIKTLTESAGVS